MINLAGIREICLSQSRSRKCIMSDVMLADVLSQLDAIDAVVQVNKINAIMFCFIFV